MPETVARTQYNHMTSFYDRLWRTYIAQTLAFLNTWARIESCEVVILDWCKDFPVCALCDIVLSAIDPAHQHCYTQRELHDLLAAAGFDVRHATRVRFGLVWGPMVATAVPRHTPSP